MERTIIEQMLEIKEQIGEINSIVKRHDEVTFPEMNKTLRRMESKQNADILRFNDEREKMDKRITILEEDFTDRKQKREETTLEVKRIKWTAISTIVIGIIIAMYQKIIVWVKLLALFILK